MIELLKAEYDLRISDLEPLPGGRVNRLWKCGDWAVKVYDHRQVPRERAERAIRLQKRAAALGFPVPEPRPTGNGALWAQSDAGMVVVMPFLPGHRRVRGTLTGTEAGNLGFLLGRLHNMFRNLPESDAPPKPPSPDLILQRWERFRDQASALQSPAALDQVVIETADYVSAALRRMPKVDWDAQPWHMCHGDLHPDNILYDDLGRVVGLLDFDNAAPAWAGVELMMAWNLCFSSDPRKPSLTSEAARFFSQYKRAYGRSIDMATSIKAYWFILVSNTWPAAIHFREGAVHPEWVELMSMRCEAAKWIEANLAAISDWFESET